MKWLEDCKNKKRKKKQTDCRIVQDFFCEDGADVCFCKNRSDDKHGQYNGTAADGGNGILQKGRQRDWQEHQEKTDENSDDARMFCQLFEGIFFVYRCKKRESCCPHGKAGRYLVHGCVHDTDGAVQSLCDWKSDKTGIGAD